MLRAPLLAVLWILTVPLVVFSLISVAGVIVRLPALMALVTAIIVTVFGRQTESRLWTTACILGIAIALSSIYPLATAHGTSATSFSPTSH